LNFDEVLETSQTIFIGGFEATATLLSGVTYLLINPSKLKTKAYLRNPHRLRNRFRDHHGLGLQARLLPPVLNEGLRMFAPIPGALRRITSPDGGIIGDLFVRGGMYIAVDL
jgi:cytochrome P450